jgi:hypothetical protein
MRTITAAILGLALGACSPETPTAAAPPPKASGPVPGTVPAAEPEPKLPPSYTGKVIAYTAPKEWVSEEPSNRLRVHQFKVPDKAGKAEAAEFVLTTTRIWNDEMREENLARWGGQMGAEKPRPETLQGKFPVTLVDLKGTYRADFAPEPVENARMLVAVVEPPGGGPWFFKLVGPADTVSGWRDDFVAMVKAAGP